MRGRRCERLTRLGPRRACACAENDGILFSLHLLNNDLDVLDMLYRGRDILF
jgi:hypothetical protein